MGRATLWISLVTLWLVMSVGQSKQSKDDSDDEFSSYDEILDFDMTVSPMTAELRLTDCKEKLRATENRMMKLQVDKTRLVKAVRDLKSERKNLRQQKKILNGNITHVQDDLKACRKDVQSLNEFIEGLQADVRSLNSQLAKTKNLKKSEKNDMTQDLATCNAQKEHLETQIKSMAKEKVTLKSQLNTLQMTIEALKSDLYSCQDKMEKWPLKVAALNEEISNLFKMNEIMQNNITALMNNNAKDQSNEDDHLEGKIIQLNGDLEQLTKLIRNSTKDNRKLEFAFNLNSSRPEPVNEVRVFKKSNDVDGTNNLQEVLENIRKESTDLQAQIQTLQEDYTLIESEAESYRAMNEVLEIEKVELLQQINTKDFEIITLKGRVTELNNRNSELQIQNFGLEENNKNLKSEVTLLYTKLESLRLHIETMKLTNSCNNAVDTKNLTVAESSVKHEALAENTTATITTRAQPEEQGEKSVVVEVVHSASTETTLTRAQATPNLASAEQTEAEWMKDTLLPVVVGLTVSLILLAGCAVVLYFWCRRAQTTTFVQGFQLDDPVPCTEAGHKNCTSHHLQSAWAAHPRKPQAPPTPVALNNRQRTKVIL